MFTARGVHRRFALHSRSRAFCVNCPHIVIVVVVVHVFPDPSDRPPMPRCYTYLPSPTPTAVPINLAVKSTPSVCDAVPNFREQMIYDRQYLVDFWKYEHCTRNS